ELASRPDTRQTDDVKAPRPGHPVGGECGAASDHAVGELIHVGPVLLGELGVGFEASGAAVDKEVDGAQIRSYGRYRKDPCRPGARDLVEAVPRDRPAASRRSAEPSETDESRS